MDLNDKRQRANNVIITGLPSTSDMTDKERFLHLCSAEFGLRPPVLSCRRLGKAGTGRSQPLLVRLESGNDAKYCVEHAKDLRHSLEVFVRNSVFINADLTKAEANAAYQQRCLRRIRRANRVEGRVDHPLPSGVVGQSSSLLSANAASFTSSVVKPSLTGRSPDARPIPSLAPPGGCPGLSQS
jgi:hypothetical protein